MPAGTQAAQICLSEEEIPKLLFPKSRRAGTVSPIIGPATYQGQGWESHCRKVFMGSGRSGRWTLGGLDVGKFK